MLCGGPAVVVSSKDDLFQLVMTRRDGPKALIDLRPDYDADYPGIDMMSFDPTKLISTPDQAVTAANTMMQMSAVGLGSGIDQVSDGGIWESTPKARWPRCCMPPHRKATTRASSGCCWRTTTCAWRTPTPRCHWSRRRRGRLTDVVDQLLAETADSWADTAAAVMEDPTLMFGDRPDHEETNGFIDRLIAQTER